MGFKKGNPGRPVGAKNKATISIKALASTYSEEALDLLVRMVRDTEAPHAARVSAANAILDRAHGKPAQAITGDEGGPLNVVNKVVFEFHDH